MNIFIHHYIIIWKNYNDQKILIKSKSQKLHPESFWSSCSQSRPKRRLIIKNRPKRDCFLVISFHQRRTQNPRIRLENHKELFQDNLPQRNWVRLSFGKPWSWQIWCHWDSHVSRRRLRIFHPSRKSRLIPKA